MTMMLQQIQTLEMRVHVFSRHDLTEQQATLLSYDIDPEARVSVISELHDENFSSYEEFSQAVTAVWAEDVRITVVAPTTWVLQLLSGNPGLIIGLWVPRKKARSEEPTEWDIEWWRSGNPEWDGGHPPQILTAGNYRQHLRRAKENR